MLRKLAIVATILLTMASACFAQQWMPAQRLDFDSELAVKTPRIYPASGGGFHATYKPTSPGWSIKYRRYQNGSLGPGRLVHTLGFLGGTNDICEAGNGDIWITWENWDQSSPNPGEQIWAARSSDNGVNWTKYAVTNYWYNQKPNGEWEGGQAKNPQIVPYGPAGSSTVLSCSHKAIENRLKYNTWDGANWSAVTDMGTWTDNFYGSIGVCRSLADGSVYRTYSRKIGTDTWQICYKRFNGAGWEGEVVVSTNASGPFASRPSIAVNQSGQIMVVWDQNDHVMARWYRPSVGWSPQMTVDSGWSASVTAIPGVDDFYIAYSPLPSTDKIVGRRFKYGGWDTVPAIISVGVAGAYTLDVDICADVDGQKLYAVWEWHGGSDPPHAWYSVFSIADKTAPYTPTVTDDGTTTDQADRLHATWSSSDPESGIVEYQYSIGTSAGATNVVGWTSTGMTNNVTKTGLSLSPGTTYFFNVMAKNGSGLWSAVGSSNGIQCTAVANNIVFNPAEVVSASADACDGPMMGKAADGGMHLVYRDNNFGSKQLGYRKYTTAGWSDIEYPVTGIPNLDYPDVAEDTSGLPHMIFAMPGYRESNDVMETVRSTGGTWSWPVNISNNLKIDWYPRIISGTGTELVHLVCNGDSSSYSLQHAYRTAAGWSTISTFASGTWNSERYGNPDAATNSSGNVLAVWSRNDGAYGRIRYSKRTGTTWSTPVDIFVKSADNFYDPRIAVGPDGLAHVVFRGNNAAGDPDSTIYYMKQSAIGSWSSAKAITSGYWATVAVDTSNRVHVVYDKNVATSQRAVFHRYYNGVAWSLPQQISGNTLLDAPHPIIRTDSAGYVHVAWDDKSSGTQKIYYRNTTPIDTSAPTVPAVTDGGVYTTTTSSISASWSSSDPETGIAEYQYAIGSSAGGIDVVGWTSAGTATSVTKTGLALVPGQRYFISVKARNGANIWSGPGSSDGITVVSDVKSSVSSARDLADGSSVGMADQTVTAVFNGFFYIEDADRSAGIKVVSDTSVTVGQKVTFGGVLATVGGERQITATSVSPGTEGNPVPAPVGMSGRALGGSSLGQNPGISGATGLYNVGLLVRTFGRVSAGGSNYFMINDGSEAVKVYSTELAGPGSYVSVTGVSSIEGTQKVIRGRNLPNQIKTL